MDARVSRWFGWVLEDLLETGRVELPPYSGGLYMKRIEKDLGGAIDVKSRGSVFEVVKGGRPFRIKHESYKHLVIDVSDKSYKRSF